MTKSTVLEKDGKRIEVRTDEQGTRIIEDDGHILHTFGGDRHEEMVENWEDDGYTITHGGS